MASVSLPEIIIGNVADVCSNTVSRKGKRLALRGIKNGFNLKSDQLPPSIKAWVASMRPQLIDQRSHALAGSFTSGDIEAVRLGWAPAPPATKNAVFCGLSRLYSSAVFSGLNLADRSLSLG